MPTLDDVRRLALAMPHAVERTSWGHTSWAIETGGKATPKGFGSASAPKAKAFVWERPFSKADIARDGEPPPGVIVAARVTDVDEKDALLRAEPGWLFTIQHFDGYAAVLVRLDEVPDDRLAEIVTDAWLAMAPARLADAWLAEHPPR